MGNAVKTPFSGTGFKVITVSPIFETSSQNAYLDLKYYKGEKLVKATRLPYWEATAGTDFEFIRVSYSNPNWSIYSGAKKIFCAGVNTTYYGFKQNGDLLYRANYTSYVNNFVISAILLKR